MEDLSRGNVLVVDDNPQVLKVTAELLRESGFSTFAFSTAREARGRLEEGDIDAVLTDIVMPEESGIELLEEIHRRDPDMPVILVTGYTDLENAMAAVKQGAFDFILKPYKIEQLVHSLKRAVNFRRLTLMESQYRRILQELNLEIDNLMAERTMNAMALTVADRIRNPASVIGLASRRLLKREEISDKVREGLAIIADEAGKLDGIVREFQDFLKQKESLYTYEDLNGVVKEAALIIGKEAGRAQVTLTLDLAERELHMNMEKKLLKIALLHLMRNALEATPEGGRIGIETFGDLNHAGATISDSGRGIPPEDIGSIFDPLFTTKSHRFGMGLPLVRQIVREHNGDMHVESTPEKGTTVRVAFPVKWEEKLPEQESLGPGSSGR